VLLQFNQGDLEEDLMVLVEDPQDLETQVGFLHLKEIQEHQVHNMLEEAEVVQDQQEMQEDHLLHQEDQVEMEWM
jgi:hypothetical protein